MFILFIGGLTPVASVTRGASIIQTVGVVATRRLEKLKLPFNRPQISHRLLSIAFLQLSPDESPLEP